MKSIFLAIATIAATITAHAQSTQSNGQYSYQQVAVNEQKILVNRCRLIKAQAYESGSSGFGSGQIHQAMLGIENYLASVRTPLALQMLGELQTAGYRGFDSWCNKYGI